MPFKGLFVMMSNLKNDASISLLNTVQFRYKLPTHEYLGNVHCQVHLIHGTADKKIYFESSEKLKQLNDNFILHNVPGGEHNLRTGPNQFSPVKILQQISKNKKQ